ncbi:MAG: hypothetical protein R3C56_41630 [Pirellulaceae bacterium]
MTPKWLLRHLQIPDRADRIVLPGYLHDGLELIRQSLGQHVECGPRDIRDLPTFLVVNGCEMQATANTPLRLSPRSITPDDSPHKNLSRPLNGSCAMVPT